MKNVPVNLALAEITVNIVFVIPKVRLQPSVTRMELVIASLVLKVNTRCLNTFHLINSLIEGWDQKWFVGVSNKCNGVINLSQLLIYKQHNAIMYKF